MLARIVFKTRIATGSLRIRAGFGNSGNIFTKDQRILAKTKIRNSKFIFKAISLEKMAFSRVPLLMGKTIFVFLFLTFIEKYMSFGVEPPLGQIAKVFC